MKNKSIASILALFLGGIGIHKFYLGQVKMGVLYLLFSWTFIPSIIGVIEFLQLLFMSNNKFDSKYNSITKTGFKSKTTKPNTVDWYYPDRRRDIDFLINQLDKLSEQNNQELFNLNFAKLIEAIRQQNENEKGAYQDMLNEFSEKYDKYRAEFEMEYPEQFLPHKERKQKAKSGDSTLLNPKSHFPLHLSNASKATIKSIRSILQKEEWINPESLMRHFSENEIICLEIENYISKYRDGFNEILADLKRNSKEYQNSGTADKLEIEEELVLEAVNQLEEHAFCDLNKLFRWSLKEKEIFYSLIEDYGFDEIKLYSKLHYYQNKLVNHWEIDDIKILAKAGLADTFESIDKKEFLNSQTLKTLNAISNQNEVEFKRKAKAIDYILENPNDVDSISNHVATRSIFKVKPLPEKYDKVEISEIREFFEYLRIYIQLLVDTHRDSNRSTEEIKDAKTWAKSARIRSHSENDKNFVCKKANQICGKSYKLNNVPKLPVHIGCNCDLEIEFD